jgi:hypothetical protein
MGVTSVGRGVNGLQSLNTEGVKRQFCKSPCPDSLFPAREYSCCQSVFRKSCGFKAGFPHPLIRTTAFFDAEVDGRIRLSLSAQAILGDPNPCKVNAGLLQQSNKLDKLL